MSRNTTRRTCSARPRRLELERLENRLVLSGVTYPSGDYAVDGVISPYGFDPDTTTLSYSFETAAGLSPFSEAFKENFREIFGWFNHTQVIDVTFAETTGGGDITITPVNYGYGQAGTGSIWMNISSRPRRRHQRFPARPGITWVSGVDPRAGTRHRPEAHV